jgi:hypothetical protein
MIYRYATPECIVLYRLIIHQYTIVFTEPVHITFQQHVASQVFNTMPEALLFR